MLLERQKRQALRAEVAEQHSTLSIDPSTIATQPSLLSLESQETFASSSVQCSSVITTASTDGHHQVRAHQPIRNSIAYKPIISSTYTIEDDAGSLDQALVVLTTHGLLTDRPLSACPPLQALMFLASLDKNPLFSRQQPTAPPPPRLNDKDVSLLAVKQLQATRMDMTLKASAKVGHTATPQ